MLTARGVITCLCITAKLIGDVRYGSKASFPTPSGHVRYYPQSDRNNDWPGGRNVPLATKVQCSEGGRLERSPGQEKY